MSASALKSTMQGVGSSPPPSGHSILPMNVVAQKVVPGTESSASMKPLSNSGMSYTMLQPPTSQQPMSLVQDHRSQVYQNQSFNNNSTSTTTATTTVTAAATTTTTTAAATVPAVSSTQAITTAGVTTTTTTTTTLTATSVAVEKDSAAGDKLITNGVEPTTTPPTNDPESIEQNKQNQDTNRNNNQSPDNTTPDTQQDGQKKTEARPIVTDTSSSAEIQITKVEESSKTPVNNGSKETEASAINEKKTDEKIVTTPVKVENDTLQVVVEKIEQKSPTTPRSTQKRKSREIKDIKTGNDGGKPKRNRVQTQPYQSPLPEIALIVKETMKKSVTPNKNPDDKLIVFYKNEFLAVRNSEGSFYVCQAMQNIYKSSRRIRIRWLSQDKNNGEIYSPDFYDFTDFDCILTNLNLNKIDKNKYQLTKIELLRTENILKRAIDVEAGVSEKPSVTEEHPDGLDLSLFKDESQLKRRKGGSNKTPKRQRKRSKQDETSSSSDDDDDDEEDDDDDDDDDTSSSDEDDDKKTNSKTSRSKRTTNKALALAKSLVKVPNRANRALLRGTRTNPIENSPSTADVKKPEVKKTTSPTTSTASTSPRTKLRGPVQSNEQESSNNLTTGRAKRSTAVAAAAAAAAAASATTTTATTTAATTGVSSTDNSSTRKKSQGST